MPNPFLAHSAFAAALACLCSVASAQTALQIHSELTTPAHVGANSLKISLSDDSGHPIDNAKITVSLAMSAMDMGTSHPVVNFLGKGVYSCQLQFSMGGLWRASIKAEIPGRPATVKSFDFNPTSEGAMSPMQGALGAWPMSKEGSGTSWLPESSPMFMKMLPKVGRYDLDLMGSFSLNYSDSGGTRGDHRFYSNSMPMLMARRETGGGILGFSLMVSLDPLFNGEWGYPDLLQTGETAHGTQLVDWQHPHDLLSGLTMSYSHPVGKDINAFLFGGPVGEPCLGGPTFMHRPSGEEIPEAPITHHWFDSTHISWGVLTAGVNNDKWQLEASAFNGHEPNENRYLPDPIRLDSAASRLTFNPNRDLSFNVSYGYLRSPESTAPGVGQHRLTAAALWNLPLGRNNLATSVLFGENTISGAGYPAYVLETTYLTGPTSVFARWENVDKDELIGLPVGTYNVNKFLLGVVQNFVRSGGFELGVGGYAGVYAFPQSVETYYGRPLTLGVFLRLRPQRM